MAAPISLNHVDLSKLHIEPPSDLGKNANGCAMKVKHGKDKLIVKLPTVLAPLGAREQKQNADKFSVAITFEADDSPDGKKVKKAHAQMSAINNRIKQLMMENKEMFFKDAKKDKKSKGVSDEVLENRYKDFMRSTDDRPDMMFLNLQRRTPMKDDRAKMTPEEITELSRHFNSFQMNAYPLFVDNDNNPIPVTIDNVREALPAGSRIRPVIELAYLWVTADKVNVIWTLLHALVVSVGVQRTFDIRRDDSDSEDDMEVEQKNLTAMAVDEDDEDEDDESVEGDEEEEMAK